MPEKVVPGPVQDTACIREAVCIHTKKIYDSCRDKDCIEDLRFYPTQGSHHAIDRALSIKAGKAELLYVYIDVEPVGFNRGFYTVDVRYFYRITADAFVGAARPVEITGLAVFDKRVILFGSEGSAKIFSSEAAFDGLDENCIRRSNMPVAVVETVDPIVLGMKLVDVCECRPCDCEITEIPPCVCSCFGNDLCFGGDSKRVYVTLGQFSIIRLERDSQLLIPVYDYCLPDKECTCGTSNGEEDPCEIFRHVRFPMGEFFPPDSLSSDKSSGQGFCCN
ncbi:MAG: hypothetical protein GX585_05785 [Clostridiales bacterium]|nr:hypothetical protein [Clostridiales bacterium]